MRVLQWLIVSTVSLLLFTFSNNSYAQFGGTANEEEEFIPEATYEIRYWTNMGVADDERVYIDTLVYFRERLSALPPSNSCLSYHCRKSDSIIYLITPKIGREKEWIMGDYYARKELYVNVPFKGYDRAIYKVYTCDIEEKNTGQGYYAFVSREFGIIYRYNADGEVFMLNRIDAMRNGRVFSEVDLLPIHRRLARTEIFDSLDRVERWAED